jgi:hypothetical protein
MKNSLHACLLLIGLASAAPAFASDPAHPGRIDFGTFSAAQGCEFVEVNLQSGLLKFAAKITATHEPEVAELLRNLESVRVNVVGLGDSNREATLARIVAVRADLESKGWEKVVTVQEAAGQGGDDVAIYMKTRGDDTIAGVVVTVIEKNGKAVLVNVVGNIRAEQIARLGEKLDIKPLRELPVITRTKVGA